MCHGSHLKRGGADVTPFCAPEDVVALDRLLVKVIGEYGLPKWHTDGSGGETPKRKVLDPSRHALKETARIDMLRGKVPTT